jgi:carbon storage regulator CsrA
MLVLSRRPEEKILLPTVPAIIKVISSQAGLVRLGIEAPAHVPILREELALHDRPAPAAAASSEEKSALGVRHVVRNRLNNLILGVTLLRMQLVEADPVVRRTLDGLEEELDALRRQVASQDPGEVVHAARTNEPAYASQSH